MGIDILQELGPFLFATILFVLGAIGYFLLIVLTRRGVLGEEPTTDRNQENE